MRNSVFLMIAALAATGLRPVGQGPQGPQGQGDAASRTTVVLSNLLMGHGRDRSGAWLPTEDFRWSADFDAFLRAIDGDGKGAVDLVLNGDSVDLWQSAGPDCAPRDAERGCTEAEALARLERVLTAHRDEIASIARFARAGANRVVFVAGDRDRGLVIPSLARRLTAAFGTPPGRVDVMKDDHWVSRDGRIYAEHGHRLGDGPEARDVSSSPLMTGPTRRHLRRSINERTLQPLWDRFEPTYPVVDNFAMATAGLRYALAADGITDLGDHGRHILVHFLFAIAWQQFRMELDGGDTEPPTWDLAKVRQEGAGWLVASVPDDDPIKKVGAADLVAGRLSGLLESLSDEELVTICDYRATVRRARRRLEAVVTQLSGRGPAIAECPRTPETRGAQFDYFWRSRDRIFGSRLAHVERQLKRPAGSIDVFVHGHTQLPDRSQAGANANSGGFTLVPEGFSPVRNAFTPVVINDGAWQRTITPVQFERLKAERQASDRDLLASLTPEQLAPCYSFVWISPYRTSAPVPAVRYWRQARSGQWAVGPSC